VSRLPSSYPFPQSLALDLSNALAGDTEGCAYLRERLPPLTERQNSAFAREQAQRGTWKFSCDCLHYLPGPIAYGAP
jgi:hypothetical protein